MRRCTAAMSVVCIQTQGCVMSRPVLPSAGTLCSYLPDATVCLSCSLCERDRSRRQADALACTAHVRRVQVVWITQSCELHWRCGQCTAMTTTTCAGASFALRQPTVVVGLAKLLLLSSADNCRAC